LASRRFTASGLCFFHGGSRFSPQFCSNLNAFFQQAFYYVRGARALLKLSWVLGSQPQNSTDAAEKGRGALFATHSMLARTRTERMRDNIVHLTAALWQQKSNSAATQMLFL